jgi:hypothetical protein
VFAWELCRLHDNFYRDDDAQAKFLRFPPHLFDKPHTAGTGALGIPAEWAFDSHEPFNAKVDLEF